MEAILTIDAQFMHRLKVKLGTENEKDILKNALVALDWMADERRKGQIIVSSNNKGQNLTRLDLPVLDRVQTR